MRNYVEVLSRSNPNGTLIIKCGMSDVKLVFERVFMCLEACKFGFS